MSSGIFETLTTGGDGARRMRGGERVRRSSPASTFRSKIMTRGIGAHKYIVKHFDLCITILLAFAAMEAAVDISTLYVPLVYNDPFPVNVNW